ncbi:MAG: hypothetical protein D6712_20095 [Chloroflexi bacterium]|nr:MAG: hypothetical protein D6712_20095 [Chloroflexota bacterium]
MSENNPNIWRLQTRFDTAGLIAALKHENTGIRKRAAAALRTLGITDAVPALKEALAQEKDAETREAISAALEALSTETKAETETEAGAKDAAKATPEPSSELQKLIGQLKSRDESVLLPVIHQLAELGDKLAAEPLVVLFNDKKLSADIRLEIAEALIKLESAPSEVALLAALRSPDWHIRRNGAAILGQSRADWAVKPLAKILDDPNEIVRKTARAALRRIGTAQAIQALKDASPLNAKPEEKAPPQKPAAKTKPLKAKTPPEKPAADEPDESERTFSQAKGLLSRLREDIQSELEQRAQEPTMAVRREDMRDAIENARKELEAKLAAESASKAKEKAEAQSEDNAEDDGEKASGGKPISWPRRSPNLKQHTAPTQPLDPSRVEHLDNAESEGDGEEGDDSAS